MDTPTFFDLVGTTCEYEQCLHALKCGDMQTVLNIVATTGLCVPEQKSILHAAILYRVDHDTLRRLLEAGVEVHVRDVEGRLPVHYAALGRSLDARDVVDILLKAGADVNGVDNQGYTPLHYACRYADESLVSFLIEAGACVDAKTNRYVEPIHFAAKNELHGVCIVRILVDAGANINTRDEDFATPLHYAAETGHAAIVAAVLGRGALVNAVDWKGRPPHHYTRHIHIVHILSEAGADLTLVDIDGHMHSVQISHVKY